MAKKAKSPQVYWDSCCFLSLIEATEGRLPSLLNLIRDVELNQLEIWTSSLSIAEVCFAKSEKDRRALDTEVRAQIDELWKPGSPFKIIEPYRDVMVTASNMVCEAMTAKLRLAPDDAIHLATAKVRGIPTVYTYDTLNNKRDELGALFGLTICDPPEPFLGTLLAGMEVEVHPEFGKHLRRLHVSDDTSGPS